MADWKAKAAEIVDRPGIIQIWDKAGYCKRCNHPLATAMVDLKALKAAIAEALEQASCAPNNAPSDLVESVEAFNKYQTKKQYLADLPQ